MVDQRDMRVGDKMWGWVKKGVPIRIEVGPKEIDEGVISVFKRTDEPKASRKIAVEEFAKNVCIELEQMQNTLFERAKARRDARFVTIDTKEEFYKYFSSKESDGGFALVHYNADHSMEDKIQEDLNVTVRCIPLGIGKEEGRCPFTGKVSHQRVVYAKSY